LALLLLGAKEVKNPFAKTKKISIEYTVQGQKNTVVIEDAKEIKEILSTIHVEETKEGPQVGLKPKCRVEFTTADKTTIKTMFVKAAHLDRSFWGQIYLKDADFYDKINEIASKKEGRKIDVLKDNK
jgi:hypothetical protein